MVLVNQCILKQWLFKIHFWHSTMCYSKMGHKHIEKKNCLLVKKKKKKTSTFSWLVKSLSPSSQCQCMRIAIGNWKPQHLQNTGLFELWLWLYGLESNFQGTSEDTICWGIWHFLQHCLWRWAHWMKHDIHEHCCCYYWGLSIVKAVVSIYQVLIDTYSWVNWFQQRTTSSPNCLRRV